MDPQSPPDDAATECFLLAERWAMSRQSRPAGKTKILFLRHQAPPSPRPPLPVLSPLALCLLLSRWDGVRDPVHKHRLHSQYVLLSGHIKLWKEVKYKSISGENTSPYQIQTNETDQRLNQPRGQGNIRVNKKVITYLQRKTWTETSKYVLYGAKKRRQIETPAECFYQDAWKADFKRNKHTVIGWVCPLVYWKKAWLVNVRLFNP